MHILNGQKKLKAEALFLAALFMLLCASAPFYAVYAGEKDQADIVRVGYFENEIFQEGAGPGLVRSGYAYDYYCKLSEFTGWDYDYVYGDFSELYQMLIDGKVDMLAGLAKTEERAGIIGYPDMPMGSETYNMVKHASDDTITTSFETLNGKKIGVLDSAMVGVLEGFLKEHEINSEVVKFPDYQKMYTAFDENAVDAFVAESDGAYGRDNAELLYVFGSSDYYLCVSNDRKDLLEELNRAQAQLISEEPNYINSLRIKYYSSSISSTAFSVVEKEWLSENDRLRIGYLNHYMPYSDTDKNGAPTGLVSELVPQIVRVLGIEDLDISYVGYDSYDDMIGDVRDSEIDVAFPVGGGLYFSEENGIYQSNPVISTGTELVYSDEYNDEKLLSFAVNENNRMQYYYIKTYFPDSEITFYPSIDDCLDALLDGRAGCTTLNGMRANDILKNHKYHRLSKKQLGKNDDRCFGVCIGNEGLLKLLNRGVNIVGEDTIQSMAYKYVDALYKYTFTDVLRDHIWIFSLILLAVAAMVLFFLIRESLFTKKRMAENEEAARKLEEKNRELASAVNEAERANMAKSYFLSTMSHDIRTPMNSILSMNEMILRECEDEDILVYSEHIRSSGNTLLGLISDILDFSKIEAGKLELIPVDYEISSVLNDLVNMLQTRVEEKGLALELSIDSRIPNYLHGDEIRLKQAVTNLLTNSVKYTKEGVVTFSMNYERIPDEENAVMLNISVRDTGIGIRKEDMEKLFEAFERLDEEDNRNIEGTGLGISITQRLLNLMGSSLQVESEYGKGSCFSFSVKQGVNKWTEVGDFEKAFRRSVSERKKYKEKFTAPDACILVVDDMPENLAVVKGLLKRTKLRVETAESGDDCISLASRKKYDIIFLDHMMPQKDGIETLRELKSLKDSPNENTPKICLTANAISGMRKNYIEAGFDDYITKPVDPDKLEEMLIKYLPKEKVGPPEDHEAGDERAGIPEFLYNVNGLDVDAGIRYCGDEEEYIFALKTYQERVRENAETIEEYWLKEDIRNMTVKIHGVKSTSRAVGALSMGNLAEYLEKAGNEEDRDTLGKNIYRFLDDYRELGKALDPIAEGSGEDEGQVKISSDELKEIIDKLKIYTENSDYDEIERIGENLSNAKVKAEDSELVGKICNAISELDFDVLEELIMDRS